MIEVLIHEDNPKYDNELVDCTVMKSWDVEGNL